MSFPTWMWLYFGSFGTAGAILFTMVVWYWLKVNALAGGLLRSAAKWNVIGLLFLFLASWFACGIAGPPGSMLSSNLAEHNLALAVFLASLSIFLSVPGFACVLVAQKKMIQALQK